MAKQDRWQISEVFGSSFDVEQVQAIRGRAQELRLQADTLDKIAKALEAVATPVDESDRVSGEALVEMLDTIGWIE
jgi:histidine ammonia-lyase